MKRFVSLLLALLLSLPLAAGAAAETFTTAYYTLTLPDGWTVVTDGAEEESKEGFEVLGYFYAPEDVGLMVEAYLVYYEELSDLALWNANEADIQEYVDAVMADYAEDDPVLLGVVTVNHIPFVLIKAADADGDYLYADTMTNGYAIEFVAYVANGDGETVYPLKDAHIEQFKTILNTFTPAA